MGLNNPKKKIYVNETELVKEVEGILKSLQIKPELLEKIIQYVKGSAKNERDYYKTRITELNKELNSIKSKLDRLMDMLLENKFTESEYDKKKQQLIDRRARVIMELEEHNKGDDNFNECMVRVLNLSANAHQRFHLSDFEEKYRILKLVFQTISLHGSKPVFKPAPPFDMMVNLAKNGEWWA